MSDEAPRSTHGNRPDQRRGRGAPAWWDLLQRSDLPDDAGRATVDTAGWDAPSSFPGADTVRGRLMTALAILAGLLVAAAIAVAVWVGTSGAGRGPSVTAAVVVGVPAALLMASLLATVVGRRRAH
jgi:hypothetical protein